MGISDYWTHLDSVTCVMFVLYYMFYSPYLLLFSSVGPYRILKPSYEASGSAGFLVGGDVGSGGRRPWIRGCLNQLIGLPRPSRLEVSCPVGSEGAHPTSGLSRIVRFLHPASLAGYYASAGSSGSHAPAGSPGSYASASKPGSHASAGSSGLYAEPAFSSTRASAGPSGSPRWNAEWRP